MSVVTINGVAETDLGLKVQMNGLGDVWSSPQMERQSAGVLGFYGSVPSPVAVGRSRRVRLSLALSASAAARRASFDTVMAHLDGMLELQWADASDRVQWARLDMVAARERFAGLSFGSHTSWGDLSVELDLILDSPVLAKVPGQIYVSSTAASVSGLGTLPSAGTFYFAGATSNLSLTLKHGLTRDTVSTLTLSGSTGAGTVTIINCARETIYTWDTTTGALTNEMDLYSSGDFPVFDPGQGDSSSPPTIESNHTGLVHYRGVYA